MCIFPHILAQTPNSVIYAAPEISSLSLFSHACVSQFSGDQPPSVPTAAGVPQSHWATRGNTGQHCKEGNELTLLTCATAVTSMEISQRPQIKTTIEMNILSSLTVIQRRRSQLLFAVIVHKALADEVAQYKLWNQRLSQPRVQH